MRLGTMTSLFRERGEGQPDIDYDEAIARCAKAGFRTLDFSMCSLNRRRTHLHEDNRLIQVDKFINIAKQSNIDFSQTHLPYRTGNNTFSSPEEEVFFKEMELRGLQISKMIGAKYAVIHPVYLESPVGNVDENIAYNRQVYAHVLEMAQKLGIGIAFENMVDHRGFYRAEDLIRLADTLETGICWDFGHGLLNYGPDQTKPLLMCGNRIKALHVHDNYGDSDTHMMIGMGKNNWPQIIKTLDDIKYKGEFILEIRTNEFMPDSLKDETAAYVYRIGQGILLESWAD